MLKYIIFDNVGQDFVVIFDGDQMQHEGMRQKIGLPVKSAGQLGLVGLCDGSVHTTGIPGSTSLHIPLSDNESIKDSLAISWLVNKL